MIQSNVALDPDQVNFCRYALRPLCFRGYFHIDWAGHAGSGRQFYRLTLNRSSSMVLMVWDGADNDWDYFIALQQLRAIYEMEMIPAAISYSREQGLVLIEDAGSRRLRDILFTGVSEQKKVVVLNSVVDQLITWSNTPIAKDSVIGSRELDSDMFIWETSYFQKHISALIPSMDALFEDQWQDERNWLAKECDTLDKKLLHRDFQSENIIIKNLQVRFVDFQGARLGAPEYDLASLLFDPYLYPLINSDVREKVLDYYAEKTGLVKEYFYLCAAQRLMQALGAYGNLSLNRGKPQYRRFVYPALVHLVEVMEQLDLTQITKIANEALSYWKNR